MKSARSEIGLAVLLAVLLVGLGSLVGRQSGGAEDVRASSFVDARRGVRALYLMLDALGTHPRRAQTGLKSGEPVSQTFAVVAPTEPVTRREVREAVAWVQSGGRLLVVAASPGGLSAGYATALLEPFGLGATIAPQGDGGRLEFGDARISEGLGRVEWPSMWMIVPAPETPEGAGAAEPLVSRGAEWLAVRRKFGEGEVVAVADSRLLDNEALGRADNAVLAARLLYLRESDEGRVAFDEFHHGFQAGDGAGDVSGALAALLTDTWPGRAILVLAAAGLLAIAGASIRFGAPDPDRPPPRRALAEHAEALGRIFETSRASREALQILAAGARRVIGPRAGVSPTLSPKEFARRLAASPAPGAAELAHAIERADAPRAVRDSELASAAAELAAAKRRFLHGGQ